MLFLFASVFYHSVKAQHKEEICTLRAVMPVELQLNAKHKYSYATENNTNEISWIFSTLFLGYKTFVSSQDMSSCTFTPSCSEYGMLAVKKQGLIIGIMNTIDRLTRCNGLSPEFYELDSKTHLLVDPL